MSEELLDHKEILALKVPTVSKVLQVLWVPQGQLEIRVPLVIQVVLVARVPLDNLVMLDYQEQPVLPVRLGSAAIRDSREELDLQDHRERKEQLVIQEHRDSQDLMEALDQPAQQGQMAPLALLVA